MKRIKQIASLSGLLLALSAPAFAQVTSVPPLMNFQGRLAKPDGTPLPDGAHSVLFSLYSAKTGGTLVWSETDSVTSRNGAFAVLLGNGSVLTDAVFAGNTWLEIKIDGAAALTPRQQIVSVAHAFKADTVPDGSITGTKIAAGTITGDKFAAGVGAFALPYAATVTLPGTAFSLTNSGTGTAISGTNTNTGPNIAVSGTSPNGIAVYGSSSKGLAGSFVGKVYVYGNTPVGAAALQVSEGVKSGVGVFAGDLAPFGYSLFETNSSAPTTHLFFAENNTGVFSVSAGGATVINNTLTVNASTVGNGISGTSSNGDGLLGNSSNGNGVEGNSSNGFGVYGVSTQASSGFGVYGSASGTASYGVFGTCNPANSFGVYGNSSKGTGVYGYSNSSGNGVIGASTSGIGVTGTSASNIGIHGISTNSHGIYGSSLANNAAGVYGDDFATLGTGLSGHGGANGVFGEGKGGYGFAGVIGYDVNANGTGVSGQGGATGVYGSGVTQGVYGESDNGFAVYGDSNAGYGVFGISATGPGVYGQGDSNGGVIGNSLSGHGVIGGSTSGDGVHGTSADGNGVYGTSSSGYAGYFSGNVYISGSLKVNTTTYTSDARYKTHVATLDNALDDVLALRGVSYDWDKAKWPAKNFPDGRQMGFIAQELEKTFPQLVATDKDGYKSVNYVGVVPVLVEAIKTQQKQLDDKQRQIDELKAQIKEIDALKKQRAEDAELKKTLAAILARLEKVEKGNSDSRQ